MLKLSPVLFMLLLISCGEQAEKKSGHTIERHINRTGYELKYPSDWIIDSTDEDFDIDSFITLETASGDGFISFFIFNTNIDTAEHLKQQINAHLAETIKNGTVTRFSDWGKYQGTGARITGKIMGVFKGEINIFTTTTDSSAFIAVYELLDRNKETEGRGFRIIKSTFILK